MENSIEAELDESLGTADMTIRTEIWTTAVTVTAKRTSVPALVIRRFPSIVIVRGI